MKRNHTESSKSRKKSPPAKEFLKKHRAVISYDKNTLGRVLKHLSSQKRKKKQTTSVARCPVEDSSENRVDHQVRLRCRQLPNVVRELRKAQMKQDWNYVATLAMILCHPGLKYYTTIILRVCFILLLNHPKSNVNLLQNFIRLTTGYVLEEDIYKFIKILFALRETRLGPVESGKYIRKTGDYKVVRDPDFENL